MRVRLLEIDNFRGITKGRVVVEVIDAPLGRGPYADPVAQYGAGCAVGLCASC